MPRKKAVKPKDDAVTAKTLFDHISAITKTKNPNYWNTLSDNDKKTFNNYMIIRYMSMVDGWMEIISELQPYIQDLPPQMLYIVLSDILPTYKPFIKYIRGEKVENYESWLVDLFTNHYSVSKKEVDIYLKILYIDDTGKHHIKEICQMYGVDEKKIKSLKLGI